MWRYNIICRPAGILNILIYIVLEDERLALIKSGSIYADEINQALLCVSHTYVCIPLCGEN